MRKRTPAQERMHEELKAKGKLYLADFAVGGGRNASIAGSAFWRTANVLIARGEARRLTDKDGSLRAGIEYVTPPEAVYCTVVSEGPLMIIRLPHPIPRWKLVLKALGQVMASHNVKMRGIYSVERVDPTGTKQDRTFADEVLPLAFKGSRKVVRDFWLYAWRDDAFELVRQPTDKESDVITKKELHEAMRVDNIRATTTSRTLRANALDNASDTVRAVALSLEVYRDRKEYDGSEHQAIDCLTRARFEIEGVEADAYES